MEAKTSASRPWISSQDLVEKFGSAKRSLKSQEFRQTSEDGKATLQVEQLCGHLHTGNFKYGHLYTDEVSQMPGSW